MTLSVYNLGMISYSRAMDLQARLVALRKDCKNGDILLLLEHPHTISLGRKKDETQLLLSREDYRNLDVEVVESNRGGGVTYHGPGQLVGYYIAAIEALYDTAETMVCRIEQGIVSFLNEQFGIDAGAKQGKPGVWVGNKKIASIGLALRQGISSHGFALNICPDLSFFSTIIPCGLTGVEMASVHSLGCSISDLTAVKSNLTHILAEELGYTCVSIDDVGSLL